VQFLNPDPAPTSREACGSGWTGFFRVMAPRDTFLCFAGEGGGWGHGKVFWLGGNKV